MTHLKKRHRFILAGGFSIYVTQELMSRSALAHSPELHGGGTTKESPKPVDSVEQQSDLESSPTEDPHTASEEVHSDEVPLQTESVTQESDLASVATPGLLGDSLPIGLGEPLFGLILAGPFLLVFLKKRFRA